MRLLSDDVLERSAVVANCRMNRERDLAGSNGYDRELGLDPLGYLKERLEAKGEAAWLDLCCGRGRALIQAASRLQAEGLADRVELEGVDLVGMFDRPEPGLTAPRPRLVEASLSTWQPGRRFDLITCVHGLHYVGDKIGLVGRAVTWLTKDGLFVANFDPANLKFGDRTETTARVVASVLRRAGLEVDLRGRRVRCRGRRILDWPHQYLGADDRAGPNATGQPAVDSHYERGPSSR